VLAFNYDFVVVYFKDIEKKAKKLTEKEEKIIDLLKNDNMLAEIKFIIFVAQVIEPLLKFLERNDNYVFDLAEIYYEFLVRLLSRVVPAGSATYRKIIREKRICLTDIDVGNVDLPEAVEADVKSEIHKFKESAAKFIVLLLDYLFKGKLFNEMLYFMKFLKKDKLFENASEDKILALCDYFNNVDKDKVRDDLMILKSTKESKDFESENIDEFYKKLREKFNFKELDKLFISASVCSFSNAEVERCFSVSGNILTKQRNRMSETNLNEKLDILAGLKLFNNNINLVPYDQKLVTAVLKSSNQYKRKMMESQEAECTENAKRQRIDADKLTHQKAIEKIRELNNDKEEQHNQLDSLKKEIKIKCDALKDLKKSLFEKIESVCAGNSSLSSLETISALKETVEKVEKEIIEKQRKLDDLNELLINSQNNIIKNYLSED
jgi:hypothetical protein